MSSSDLTHPQLSGRRLCRHRGRVLSRRDLLDLLGAGRADFGAESERCALPAMSLHPDAAFPPEGKNVPPLPACLEGDVATLMREENLRGPLGAAHDVR